MTKKSIESLVGLFVLLGILAVTFIALKAANLGSFGNREGYMLQARFDNIGSLKPRAPVRSAGVTVGRVVSIRLDPKTFQGLVTMEIERDLQFPRDSSAKILTAGLLGDQYVGLEAGGEDKNLGPGDAVTQTQSAVVLENLISQFLFNKAGEAGVAAPAGRASAPATGGAKK
jgi:phospholipid/cholesterol/gamma-HCH transport system substrate-binding protein